jgi:uncharacterized protein YabE (DUF348 family)
MEGKVGGPRDYFYNFPKNILLGVLLALSITITLVGMKKTVTINLNGQNLKVSTFRSTVAAVLESKKIVVGPKDKTSPELTYKIKDGDVINIKTAVDVYVQVDGKNLGIKSAEESVKDLLAAEGIRLGEDDKISPQLTSSITKGINIKIIRVDAKIVEEKKVLDYATIYKSDSSLVKGNNKVVQDGQEGEKIITHKLIYEDGKVVSNKLVSEVVTKNPVNKIINRGVLGVLNISRGGSQIYYTKALKFRASAYTAASCGKSSGSAGYGRTATGVYAKRDPNGYSTVAVDPKIIPYGTKLYISGYGLAIAQDTGGAINGYKLDLYFNTLNQCFSWGVRNVTVYVLR